MKSYSKVIVLIVLCLIIWSYSSAQNANQVEYAKGEVLIAFTQDISDSQILQTLDKYNLEIITAYSIVPNAYLVRQKGLTTRTVAKNEERDVVQTLVANLEREANVLISEPNYKVYAIKASNDYGLECLWAFNNIGQTGGTVDADIDAFEAWDLTTGSSAVIVGIIDTGIDYDHPDLADNIWKNPGEIPDNDIDDDKNGYVDDIYGWDWAYNDNNPSDYCGHGTHCAGTVGAVGNNGEGVAGVCWNVKLMALKFLDDTGEGWTSDAISAIEYATKMGATLTSNSWGGGEYETLLEAAIDSSNMLFVAAASNDDLDNDIYPQYPSSYDLDNIIAVAATDHDDDKAYFSNYGATSVDLGAPGVDILSTKPDNPTDIFFDPPGCGLSSVYYGVISGTSMATPHVSGTAALLYSWNPSLTWSEAKAAILENVDPVASLSGITVTGGRLNVYNAVVSVQTGIIVSSDSLNFGIVGIGETDTLKLDITNATDSDVTVNLSSDNDVFSLAVSSVFLTNGSSELVDIYFSPISQQTYNAILTCDAGDTVIYVNMIGTGEYLPIIEVSPEKLYFELSSEDSETRELTISNIGMADLTWNISGILGIKSNMNQYAASYYQAIPKGAPDTRIGNVATSSSGGPDTYGYTWIDSDIEEGLKFEWIDISSTGTPVTGLSDDNFVGPFPIEFTFNYYGIDYTEFYIASNGYIGFGPTDNYNNQNNYPLPHSNTPNNLLAWCWDDLDIKSGSVFYEKINNKLVIQFIDYGEFGADGTVNAEIILDPNGAITYQYLNFQNGFDVLHSTVGIENSDGTNGLEVVFNNSYLHDSLAVQFSTNQWLSVTPQSGTIQTGNSEKINVSANSSGLNAGTYKTYLAINNNDLDKNPANVPITMTIEAQNVTFSVNMSIYESVGYFNPGVADYVTIPGTFNDWADSAAYQLAHIGGGIYEGTFPFYGTVGDTVQYKYFIHAGDGRSLPNGGWEDSVDVYSGTEGNRGFLLTGGDQILSTVYFNNNDKGFPAITATPDSFVVTLVEGDSAENDLTIGNNGATDLIWDILITNSAETDNGNLSKLAKLFTTKERPLTHEDSLSLYLFPKHEYITRIPPKINLNSDPIIFFDDFESGNYDQWIPTGGSYIREVTSETAANGKYSFKQTGYGDHFSGVYATFDRSTPSTISFYVRPTSYSSAHCYFVIGDDDILYNVGIAFFYAYNGNFWLYASSQVISEVPYNINEWYHIELRNIDYVNKRFDYYINSQLIVTDFPFRSQTSSYISTVYLYNYYTDATAFYDDIAIGSYPIKSWLTVTPDSGVVSPLESQTVKVGLNAARLPHGNYEKFLVINSNDPVNRKVNVPVKVSVLMRDPPEISVTPDSFMVELFEGDSTTELLTIENTGVGDLDWDMTLKAYSSTKRVYTLSLPSQIDRISQNEDLEHSTENKPVRDHNLKAKLEDLDGVKILWDNSHGQGGYYYWSIIVDDLTSRGAIVEENFDPITSKLLEGYDVFWTKDLDYDYIPSEIDAIKNWLINGGALLLEGDNTTTVMVFNNLLSALNAGIVYNSIDGTDGITTNIYPHEMTTNVKQIYLEGNIAHLSAVTSPAEILIEDRAGVPNSAYSIVGRGRILAMADEIFSDDVILSADNQLFANQAFDWLAKGGTGWLTYTPRSGSITPDDAHEVKLKFNASDLSFGKYEAMLSINSNDPDEPVIDVLAALVVTMANPPKMVVTPDSVDVELIVGDSTTKNLEISNNGTGNLTWSLKIIENNTGEQTKNLPAITPLYKKYKQLLDSKDNHNPDEAKAGPIPLTAINSLSGTTKILAWTTYTDMNIEYRNTLNAISKYYSDYTVTNTEVTDPSTLETELADKDVFLIPEQEGGYYDEFFLLGILWEDVLNNFVNRGGIVILCGSSRGSEQILNASGLMYMDYYDYESYGNMRVLDTEHFVTKGLPSSIPVQRYTMFYDITDSEADNLVTYGNFVSVAAKDIGNGHVVLAGYDFYYYDDNAALIISNAVKGPAAINWISVTPDSGTVIPQGSQDVSLNLNSAKLTPGEYSANLRIESNDPYNQVKEIPVDLTVLTPPEITVTPDSFFVELPEADSTTHKLQIGNTGNGNLNWSIDITHSNNPNLQNKKLYSTTPLFNKYKHLSSYVYRDDNNNNGKARVGPISMKIMNLLNGTTEILAWTTYSDMEDEYRNTLNAISQYYTDYTVSTTTVTDSTALKTELADKHVFLIPEQEGGNSSEYSSLGKSWKTVLTNFVHSGGTVILCGSSKGTEQILKASGLMYLDYYDTDNPSAMTVVDRQHYVTSGLPATIPAQNATMFYEVSDTTVDILVTHKDYTAIAAKDVGRGHVVLVGFDFHNYDDNGAKIISNAVQWSTLITWLSVVPDSGTVEQQSTQEVNLNIDATELTAGKYYANLAINSNDPDTPVTNVSVNLTVLTPEPPQITVIPDSIIVELTFRDSTTQKLKIDNGGTRSLNWSIEITPVYSSSKPDNAVYNTTPLYNRYKYLSGYEDRSDNNNQGNAKVGPIPLNTITSLSGAKQILAWTKYTDINEEFHNTMNAISQFYTDFTVTTTTVTDSAALDAELADKNIFLIPEQEGGSASEFSSLGSLWNTVLYNFVKQGGSVILCGSDKGSEQILKTSGLMHLDYHNMITLDALTVLDTTHFLTNGLPSSIPAQNATMVYNITDSLTDVLITYKDYATVAAKNIGRGHVILVGFDFYNYDDYAAKIIANAVRWLPEIDWLTVTPNSGTVTWRSSQEVSIIISCFEMANGKYFANLVVHSNDPDNPTINVPVILTVLSVGPTAQINEANLNTIPEIFELAQNYPNPFNPVTNIKYQLASASYVTLKIYDMLGREVITLVDKQQKAGYYNIQWNGKTNNGANVPSGVYFYSIKTAKYEKTRKMLLIK